MIKIEDLKDGMTVWIGSISFNGGRTIRDYPTTYSRPKSGTVKIINASYGKAYSVVDPAGLEIARVLPSYYGTYVGNTLYSSYEELVVDWNRALQTEIDRRKALVEKSELMLKTKYML